MPAQNNRQVAKNGSLPELEYNSMNAGKTGNSLPRRMLSGLVMVLFGTAVALLVFEIIVRIFFEEPIMPRFVMDPGYGVRAQQPNIVTRHYMPGEYEITISTNSGGMRGKRDYSLKKPEGVYRIALLGDSFIYGHGVNDPEVVSAVLEGRLNSQAGAAGTRYEVLNFGVSGFGQAEELITYRENVRKYNPDAVVVFYFDNDIGNNAVSRLYRVDDEGNLVRDADSYLPGVKAREIMYSIPPVRWLFEYSQGWNLIRNRLSSLVQKSLLKQQGLRSFNDTSEDAVELTRALLVQFIADIRGDGAQPIIFIIPHKKMKSNFPLEKRVINSEGAMLINGNDFMDASDYYVIDSHWNASGHKKAAAVIAQRILDGVATGVPVSR